MNLKKIMISVIMIMMLMVFIGLPTTAYATTQYMGVVPFMTNGAPAEPSMGYAINNQAVIWNIVKYASADATTYSTTDNIYCIKAGVGFADPNVEITNLKKPYDVFYDMKTQRETIKNQNEVLKTLVENTITDENGKTISCYDALLAVLDMLYLPGESDPAEVANINEKVLELAKKDDDYIKYRGLWNTAYTLTENDIEAVQQAVIWYFTNYYKMVKTENSYSETKEHETKYDLLNQSQWLYYKLTNMTNYDRLANYTPNGQSSQYDAGYARSQQAEILYQYMIRTAKQKANEYTNASATTGAPVEVEKTTLTSTVSGDRCIVGPIHITKRNPTPYTIDIKVNEKENNYQLVDETQIPEGKDFYISIPKSEIDNLKIDITVNYNQTTMTLMASNTNKQEQPLVEVHKENKSQTVTLTYQPEPEEKPFDLALRKYITKKNGTELTGDDVRVPNVDESTIKDEKTATYKHKKAPLTISTGDVITYKMTIYNEGEKAGRATKVVDQLPAGLKFDKVVDSNGKSNFELDNYNEANNTLTLKRKEGNTTNLPAYEAGNLQKDGKGTETIEIECTVTEKPDTKNSKILTNVAWIAEEVDEDGTVITTEKGKDRDSEPGTKPDVNKDNMSDYKGNGNKEDLDDSNYYYKGQQDDDDFEKLVLLPENFDLALRKYVSSVNDNPVDKRIEVDVSNLNKVDQNGNIIATTANYKENKPPVSVAKGDIVTYTFRIYNEGTLDGYAQEITEDIPEGLEFIWSEKEGEELAADTTLTAEEKEAVEFNQKYLWGKFVFDEKKEKIIKISSDYLAKETAEDNLIPAFGKNDGSKKEEDLKYKEIAVKFKVVSDDTTGNIIRNEAAITGDADEDGEPVDDRDSDPDIWKEHPDHEDDEDHDYIILQSFDLALRKFIIAVSKDTKIENEEYLKNQDGSYVRAPKVDTSKLNTIGEDGKLITTAVYTHTKEPVMVQPNDIVVYMLRVYNEGDVNGYAAEIKDHLPPYLEYVDSDFNKEYGWSVSEDGRTVTTNYLAGERFLINKTKTNEKGEIELSYQEVPIMCKVSEKPKTNENITNIADITKYLDEDKKPANDRDSSEDNVKLPEDKDLPGYNDHQEDDDDYEKLIVKIFDLALRKWVTQAIVIENGQETVTQTGHDPWDDPEDVVKVELHRKKINQVTVKFRYSIRVYNQGEIAGYAKEITDYVPEGLKFVAEDNPGWTDEGNNVISTRLLENTLLQPGEYADVEVLLTWINNENNMGLKTNTAEISEDYNEYGVPDIDSTPDNKKPGEDDIDDAPVMLSVTTGQVRIYFTLGFIILVTVASGIILIKKYVL